MNRTKLALALAPVWAVALTLSIVFQGTDPGARGLIADVSFFTWLVCSIALLVIGASALVHRMRGSAQSSSRERHQGAYRTGRISRG